MNGALEGHELPIFLFINVHLEFLYQNEYFPKKN